MRNGNGRTAHSTRRRRAVLFIDYENARYAAQELFEQLDGESTTSNRGRGDFHPRRLGEKLCAQYNRRPECQSEESKIELVEVRVYRGKRDPSKDRLSQLALRADEEQVKVWQDPSEGQTACAVRAITFPMQYPEARYSVPRERDNRVEKEVDAAIAMDLLSITDAECDVAVLWSNDTDLCPVVCELMERAMRGKGKVELHLAGWARAGKRRILNPESCSSWSEEHPQPHHHRVFLKTYESVRDETDYIARAKGRTADYLTGRYNDREPFTCRLMRLWCHRRRDDEDETKVGVHVQVLEIGTQYPVYFERLIDGESVRENFEAHRGADRSFRVQEMYPATDDQRAFFVLAEVGLRRARVNRNPQRTGAEEVRPAKARTNRRAHTYVHGEFVPARVTRVLTGRVEVQTIYGDVGWVADDDLVPEKKLSDDAAEGDILPLVVSQPGRRLGLELVEERSEKGRKAKDDGWRFNTDGCLAVPPDDVAKQFQDQHD